MSCNCYIEYRQWQNALGCYTCVRFERSPGSFFTAALVLTHFRPHNPGGEVLIWSLCSRGVFFLFISSGMCHTYMLKESFDPVENHESIVHFCSLLFKQLTILPLRNPFSAMADNGHRFQPGQTPALADPHLLKTSTEYICKLCHKIFKISKTANTQRSARRHVPSHLDGEDVLFGSDNFDPDNIYVNDFEDLEIDDLPHQAETQPVSESFPAVLFGLIYIRFGFSEREADALLRLLKLNLNFSNMKNAPDVLKLVGVANATEHAACRNCGKEGILDKNQMTCDNLW